MIVVGEGPDRRLSVCAIEKVRVKHRVCRKVEDIPLLGPGHFIDEGRESLDLSGNESCDIGRVIVLVGLGDRDRLKRRRDQATGERSDREHGSALIGFHFFLDLSMTEWIETLCGAGVD